MTRPLLYLACAGFCAACVYRTLRFKWGAR
jgi:hypothetical protein